jgi:hypothetical protein
MALIHNLIYKKILEGSNASITLIVKISTSPLNTSFDLL